MFKVVSPEAESEPDSVPLVKAAHSWVWRVMAASAWSGQSVAMQVPAAVWNSAEVQIHSRSVLETTTRRFSKLFWESWVTTRRKWYSQISAASSRERDGGAVENACIDARSVLGQSDRSHKGGSDKGDGEVEHDFFFVRN